MADVNKVRTDLCAGKHGGAETSAEAYSATPGTAREAQRAKILWFIAARQNGATCDEAETVLGLSHQTCSARITDLLAEGKIRFAAEKRPTRTGRAARVYFKT